MLSRSSYSMKILSKNGQAIHKLCLYRHVRWSSVLYKSLLHSVRVLLQDNPCKCVDIKLSNASILFTTIVDITADRDAWIPEWSPEDKARILHYANIALMVLSSLLFQYGHEACLSNFSWLRF